MWHSPALVFLNVGSTILLNGHMRRQDVCTTRSFFRASSWFFSQVQLLLNPAETRRSRQISHLTDGNGLSRVFNSLVLFFVIENWKTWQENRDVLDWWRMIMLDVSWQTLSIILSSAAFSLFTDSPFLWTHRHPWSGLDRLPMFHRLARHSVAISAKRRDETSNHLEWSG